MLFRKSRPDSIAASPIKRQAGEQAHLTRR